MHQNTTRHIGRHSIGLKVRLSSPFLSLLYRPANTCNNHHMPLQDRLRKLMTDNNVSNYSLSRHLQVSEKAVRKWKNGEAAPRGKNLTNLAAYFNVHPAWLQFGEKAYAPTLKDSVMQIAEDIETIVNNHPEKLDKIRTLIGLFKDDDFQERHSTTKPQAEREKAGRTKKSRRKTA